MMRVEEEGEEGRDGKGCRLRSRSARRPSPVCVRCSDLDLEEYE